MTPQALWNSYVAEAWQRDCQTVQPRTGMPRRSPNPREHLASALRYSGYSDGTYTIAARDEGMRAWAERMMTASLSTELTLYARRHGISKRVSVRFVTEAK